jgi:Omp85 superfamily domain
VCSRLLIAIAAAMAAASAVAQQATTTAWPPRPTVMLAPSASPTYPAGPMRGMELIDDLDRPAAAEPTPKGNWVIAPIPFRNELLGAGLVLGAGYLYGASATEDGARHSVAAAAGMYAEGGSWSALAAHRGYWSGQRRRTTVAVATGELLYDIELELADSDRKLGLQQQFSGISLEAAQRVGASGWLGLGYRGGDTQVEIPGFADPLPEEIVPGTTIELSNVLLTGELDTRDSDLYPRSGRYAQAEALIARHELGSDYDYMSLELEWNSYRRIRDAHVLAWRVAGKLVDGDAPFFAMSWFGAGVDLRGYTPGRYIGESMIAAQAEWRWQATSRWGFAAFGGAGKVSGALGDIDTDRWLPAGGVGIRFRLVKALPLNMRADFAWGRDDSTFALSIGEAF